MNNVSKLYEVYINRELQTAQNEILNTKRIQHKILAFLNDLSQVAKESRCYLFWEKEDSVNHQQLLEYYFDGLTMLMSIGYELRIDSIKNHTEIPAELSLEEQFFKIYQSILNVQQYYSSDAYQNTIDDYFTLGFQLGISVDEILFHYR